MKHIYKIKYVIITLLVVISGFAYSCSFKDNAVIIENEKDTTTLCEESFNRETSKANLDELDENVIFIYITGSVISPGVYKLPPESHIFDVVEAAGGFSEQADVCSINMASILSDGDHIHVCAIGEAYTSESNGQSFNGLVNINTANKEQLMTLQGIGETRADSIITYRDTVGAFNTIEDIMKVSGIKEAAFAKIKEDICVE